jgi:predicted DNA-binding antitoxin AbrB/MazE fold protein
MKTIHAVFENGIFRPTEPVDLPEGIEVTVQLLDSTDPSPVSPHLKRIYELLSESFDTNDPGLSERHNG